jgi:single-stranded DNA-binding protein
MYNFKKNQGFVGGLISNLNIRPSKHNQGQNAQVHQEYYGEVFIDIDNGKHVENVKVPAISTYQVDVSNRICSKVFESGLNIGDQILFLVKFIDKDNHKIKSLQALDIITHITKTFIDAAIVSNMKFFMKDVKANEFSFAGNVSQVKLQQASKANTSGEIETFGSISIALDDGRPGKENQPWDNVTYFIEAKLNHNLIKRIKSGIKVGDQIEVSGYLVQEKWIDKQTKVERSVLKLIATNVHAHMDKDVAIFAKNNGYYSGNVSQSTSSPQQQGGFANQAPQQQGGFVNQDANQAPQQQGGFVNQGQQKTQQGNDFQNNPSGFAKKT